MASSTLHCRRRAPARRGYKKRQVSQQKKKEKHGRWNEGKSDDACLKENREHVLHEGQKMTVDFSKLFEALTCIICFCTMHRPIYQCEEGHSICKKCAGKLSCCPVCKCDEISLRNRGLEAIADCIGNSQCKYHSYGCKAAVTLGGKGEHEKQCYYKPLKCWISGCDFKGDADSFAKHLVTYHGHTQVFLPSNEGSLSNLFLFDTVITCHGRHFYFCEADLEDEQSDDVFAVCLLCLGNPPYGHGYGNRYTMSFSFGTLEFKKEARTTFWGGENGPKFDDCLLFPRQVFRKALKAENIQEAKIQINILPSFFRGPNE